MSKKNFMKEKHAVKAFEVFTLFLEVTTKLGADVHCCEISGNRSAVVQPGCAGWGACKIMFLDLPVDLKSVVVLPDFENGQVDVIPRDCFGNCHDQFVLSYEVQSNIKVDDFWQLT